MMNKKGMTLVELLVYMVLAALLLAPVIMLMQNSSVNMARDAVNVNLRMTGRELLNIIYDDLRNTGYKLDPNGFKADTLVSYVDTPRIHQHINLCSPTPAPATTTFGRCPVRLDSVTGEYDVSSFISKKGQGNDNLYDTLTVRMGRLNNAGTWRGIDTVTYWVENRDLKRSIKGISNTAGNTVTLAKNIEALKFLYSDSSVYWYATFLNNVDEIKLKGEVQYIKVIIVQKDDKKLSATKTTSITLIEPDGDDYPNGLTLTRNDLALYERHEIVIPIPNNGLFP